MSDESGSSAAKPTRTYPTDVSKAMQLLLAKKILDADAVVKAFDEVRDDAARVERESVLSWLRKRPCPTPGTWSAMVEAIERGEHKDGAGGVIGRPIADAPAVPEGEERGD